MQASTMVCVCIHVVYMFVMCVTAGQDEGRWTDSSSSLEQFILIIVFKCNMFL